MLAARGALSAVAHEANMSTAFERIFDEPTAVDASTPPKTFKVAPTFVIDLSISLVCILVIVPAWKASFGLGIQVDLPTFVLGLLILACYAGKVLVIWHLSRKGGDARTYVKSAALVTDGPYAFSRHPTYLVAMAQFALWSALALYLQVFLPFSPALLAAAIGLPVGFFLINDLVVMPTEEAMLRRLHPEEFDAYARRVRRWFGRRA
jgi:protein-S-isoprenylcysteine O-methyltransferase Ste14